MRVKRFLVTLIQDDITQIMCIYGRANRDESHEKEKVKHSTIINTLRLLEMTMPSCESNNII